MTPRIIYTIGHSTHSLEDFLQMLQSFHIQMLADIRNLPGSRKYPQFNQDNLAVALPEHGIMYTYLSDLGGRRRMKKDSKNTRWHNHSFRGYADYMDSEAFEKAIQHLEEIATQQTTAVMCAEAVWWRCHRSMLSDALKVRGWTVRHIMKVGKADEHRYTAPAVIVDGNVSYANTDTDQTESKKEM